MQTFPNHEVFSEALRRSITAELKRLVEEERQVAVDRLHERIALSMDHLALKILSEYEVSMQRDRVVITVRKPSEGG